MKKLFNHTKKPVKKWQAYEDDNYDWDEYEDEIEYDAVADEDGKYYADGEYYSEEAEEGDYAEGAEAEYYSEEAEGSYYTEGAEATYYSEEAEGSYYTEGAEATYYSEEAEGSYYTEGAEAAYYSEEAEEGYYAEGAEAEYYSEEAEEGYCVEEAETAYYSEEAEEGYYAEGEEAEYYSEEAEGGYYAEGAEAEYYSQEAYYEEDTEEAYYADEDEYYEPVRKRASVRGVNTGSRTKTASKPNTPSRTNTRRKRQNDLFATLLYKFQSMGTMDRIVATTGVLVLVMALITGAVYAGARSIDKQVSEFASVGTQLEGIEVIGERGLLAVADATQARIAAANAVQEQEEQAQQPEYNEIEYSNTAMIDLELVSVQKDLKIKFTNYETGKLVSNVPFAITVTDPDGQILNWLDDDMDGIIYKKGITPGKYKVSVDALTDEKYKKYILPTGTENVEVKKDIEYKKINVKNEIKKESEVNVSKEDTKKNETVVESRLEDTVTWVESTSTANTYIEVAKSTVPDPLNLVARGSFMRMAQPGNISASSQTMKVGESFTLTAQLGTASVTGVTWSSSNPAVATVTGTSGGAATVTALSEGSTTISYAASVSSGDAIAGSCTVTVLPAVGTVTVDSPSMVLAAGSHVATKAAATGFTAGRPITYQISSANAAVATASIDASGVITVQGVAAGDTTLTITANYSDNPAATPATASIAVKVTAGLAVALDKTAVTAYVTEPATPVKINATIANATTQAAVQVESSDTTVATVAANGREVIITPIKVGSATIVVKYVENGLEVKATCAVTVKAHPKGDRETKLKDAAGVQLYVLENEVYREAVYADYYTAEKFFVKGNIKYTGWQTIDGKVYFYNASGEKVTGEQVIQGAKYTFASDGSLVTGSGTMGIDVSKWNGTIDWNAVKNSGVSYVIIRSGYRGSSQGSLIEDPKFKKNIQGATEAGLKVGIYFFTQAVDEVEAVEEASMVLEQIKNYRISYPIFLDVEPSGGRGDRIDKTTRTKVCKAFCKTIQDAGYTAGIYANKTWLTDKIDTSQLGAYKIWLAQYAATPTYTGRYDMWQYTSTGKVSGISGDVDLNLSYLGY